MVRSSGARALQPSKFLLAYGDGDLKKKKTDKADSALRRFKSVCFIIIIIIFSESCIVISSFYCYIEKEIFKILLTKLDYIC